jgi:cysteine synthase
VYIYSLRQLGLLGEEAANIHVGAMYHDQFQHNDANRESFMIAILNGITQDTNDDTDCFIFGV